MTGPSMFLAMMYLGFNAVSIAGFVGSVDTLYQARKALLKAVAFIDTKAKISEKVGLEQEKNSGLWNDDGKKMLGHTNDNNNVTTVTIVNGNGKKNNNKNKIDNNNNNNNMSSSSNKNSCALYHIHNRNNRNGGDTQRLRRQIRRV